jgi:xylan 1,4-beta-xylosidase
VKHPNFHSHHAPFGAFASFTVGLIDSPGGFGQSLSRPHQVKQNVYVGFRKEPANARALASRWSLLPFMTPPQVAETAYLGENAPPPPKPGEAPWVALAPSAYKRTLGAATDTWSADSERFGFSLLTPVDHVPDPRGLKRADARRLLAPVVTGWIEYDNREGSVPVQLIFGIGDPERPLRPLADSGSPLAGFSGGPSYGYATRAGRDVELRQGFDVFLPKFKDHRGLHVIGGESALVFTVPAGKRKRFPLSLGFYEEGTVTTGLPAKYAYTRWFSNLEDVLEHGLAEHANYARLAVARDRELERSRLDADQRFLLAQSIHSYQGCTQLLWNDEGPLWMVNEGEYRMINTFDLTVDHLFYELEWQPWAVRDTLDLFVNRYAYTDQVRNGTPKLYPGGISFTHDMGVMNHFTPAGRSSYECDGLHGCFGHMTMEQLLNWVLCAVTYAEKTGDIAWLRSRRDTLLACAESMHRRDHPNPKKRDGILKHDSSRCGLNGAEITTYDSLDVSLGQARNNLYLAVKTLGAWVLLEKAFARLRMKEATADAHATADLLARSIEQKFEADTGFFPAVFENENRSRILPAVEGFVYPLYLGYDDAIDPKGRFGPLLALLRQHITQALQPGVCLDSKSGGWKISSTSSNTWFSKIALAQYVVRRLFPEAMNRAARGGDRVHADWQRQPGCGRDAMCDQIISTNGESCGSRYYPRGVTAWLWLAE